MDYKEVSEDEYYKIGGEKGFLTTYSVHEDDTNDQINKLMIGYTKFEEDYDDSLLNKKITFAGEDMTLPKPFSDEETGGFITSQKVEDIKYTVDGKEINLACFGLKSDDLVWLDDQSTEYYVNTKKSTLSEFLQAKKDIGSNNVFTKSNQKPYVVAVYDNSIGIDVIKVHSKRIFNIGSENKTPVVNENRSSETNYYANGELVSKGLYDQFVKDNDKDILELEFNELNIKCVFNNEISAEDRKAFLKEILGNGKNEVRFNSNNMKPDPIYVVTDKIVSEETLKDIDPSSIKEIKIIKNQKATDKYGAKGKNGVIEISTYSVNENEELLYFTSDFCKINKDVKPNVMKYSKNNGYTFKIMKTEDPKNKELLKKLNIVKFPAAVVMKNGNVIKFLKQDALKKLK